jgi:hypothetical protein
MACNRDIFTFFFTFTVVPKYLNPPEKFAVTKPHRIGQDPYRAVAPVKKKKKKQKKENTVN